MHFNYSMMAIAMVAMMIGRRIAAQLWQASLEAQRSMKSPPARPWLAFKRKHAALITLCAVAWMGIHSWLEYRTGWPGRYGLQCLGRCDLLDSLSHSYLLLRIGSPSELALFGLIWFPVAGAAIVAVLVLFGQVRTDGSESSTAVRDEGGPVERWTTPNSDDSQHPEAHRSTLPPLFVTEPLKRLTTISSEQVS